MAYLSEILINIAIQQLSKDQDADEISEKERENILASLVAARFCRDKILSNNPASDQSFLHNEALRCLRQAQDLCPNGSAGGNIGAAIGALCVVAAVTTFGLTVVSFSTSPVGESPYSVICCLHR